MNGALKSERGASRSGCEKAEEEEQSASQLKKGDFFVLSFRFFS